MDGAVVGNSGDGRREKAKQKNSLFLVFVLFVSVYIFVVYLLKLIKQQQTSKQRNSNGAPQVFHVAFFFLLGSTSKAAVKEEKGLIERIKRGNH